MGVVAGLLWVVAVSSVRCGRAAVFFVAGLMWVVARTEAAREKRAEVEAARADAARAERAARVVVVVAGAKLAKEEATNNSLSQLLSSLRRSLSLLSSRWAILLS